MIIRSVKLNNIRSYDQAHITFPEGTILLCGDVGSGKSSILLAVEFSLFGLIRGELDGSSLLKNGASEGLVTLEFSLDKEVYEVTRTLKRDSKGVKQVAGELVIGGVREKLLPSEITARVLSILGYPTSSSQTLLYRYTVYTPQEEMKRILFDNADYRLEALRKMFGIDQYKHIKNNSTIILKDLRAEQRALKMRCEELPHKEKSLRQLTEQQLQTQKEQVIITKEHSSLHEQLLNTEESLTELRAEYSQRVKAREEQQVRLRNKEVLSNKIQTMNEELVRIENELSTPLVQVGVGVDAELRKHEEFLDTSRVQRSQVREERSKVQEQQARTRTDQERLLGLSRTCPTCQQQVGEEHKGRVCSELAREADRVEQLLVELNEKISRFDEREQKILRNLEKLKSTQKQYVEQRARSDHQLRVREGLLARKEALSKTIQSSLQELESMKPIVFTEDLKEQEERIRLQEEHVRGQRQTTSVLAQKKSALAERLEQLSKRIQQLEQELGVLKGLLQRSTMIGERINWLGEVFLPATNDVEQVVLRSIHQEFNALVSNWFDTIMGDDRLVLRLDESFTPLVTQNGYDMTLVSLSGGEKTAVALAYRLALNHCITHFSPSIGTRELLILDEPTDGFSEQQLDRMREVFDALSVRQLIIVSHEQRIEGLVDHTYQVVREPLGSVVRAI